MGNRYADHVTPLYPQKLALTSPTGGGRSVGIVRSRTKATEFSLYKIQSILEYGAEVWQISTREINKILSTEMDVLRSARKSRMERIKHEHIKEIRIVKGKPDIMDSIERKRLEMVWPRQKDARGENTEINYGMDTTGEKEKRTSKKKRGWKEYKQK